VGNLLLTTVSLLARSFATPEEPLRSKRTAGAVLAVGIPRALGCVLLR
jgi:hypothetical protein